MREKATIGLFVAGRQNEYGRAGEPIDAPKLAANFQTVESRQHQIQNDEIRWIAADFSKSNGPVGSVIDSEAFLFEVVLQQLDEIVIVFDNQNFFQHLLIKCHNWRPAVVTCV